MNDILQIISAGGDTAMMVVAFAIWNLNKRISTVETKITVLTGGKA